MYLYPRPDTFFCKRSKRAMKSWNTLNWTRCYEETRNQMCKNAELHPPQKREPWKWKRPQRGVGWPVHPQEKGGSTHWQSGDKTVSWTAVRGQLAGFPKNQKKTQVERCVKITVLSLTDICGDYQPKKKKKEISSGYQQILRVRTNWEIW